MKASLLLGLSSAALVLGLSAQVAAIPFNPAVQNDAYSGVVNGIPTANDWNDGQPDQFEAVNALLGTNYTANADLDSRFIADDAVFYGTGAQTVALIGLTAGNLNTLGVYTDLGVGTNRTEVLGPVSGFGMTGAGTFLDPFMAVTFDIVGQFSWFLQAYVPNDNYTHTFYSDSALNSDGLDHMKTFAMPELNGQTIHVDYGTGAQSYTFKNAFLIGWEDLPNGHYWFDDDYDDMLYLVDFSPVSVAVTVTESSHLMLLALGLCALVIGRRRVQV